MNQKYHPLVFTSFLLAALCCSPIGVADYLAIRPSTQQIANAIISVLVWVIIVVTLLGIADRQTTKHPDKYKPRSLSRVTWAIVIIGALLQSWIILVTAVQ